MDAVNLGGPGGSRWGMAGLVGPGGRLGLPAGRGRAGGGVAGRVAGRVGPGGGGMAGRMGPGCREKLSLGRKKMIWGRENSEKCKNCRGKKYNGGVGGLEGAAAAVTHPGEGLYQPTSSISFWWFYFVGSATAAVQ